MSGLELKGIEIFLSLLNMGVSTALWMIVRANKRQQATSTSIKELEEKFTGQLKEKCSRITKIENHVASMPTNDHIVRIHQRLDEINKSHHEVALMLGDIGGQIKQIAKNTK